MSHEDRQTAYGDERERCGVSWGGSTCVRFANHTGRHQSVVIEYDDSPRMTDSTADVQMALRPRGAVPTERLRALVRLLYPEEITPTAKRMIERTCEEYE